MQTPEMSLKEIEEQLNHTRSALVGLAADLMLTARALKQHAPESCKPRRSASIMPIASAQTIIGATNES